MSSSTFLSKKLSRLLISWFLMIPASFAAPIDTFEVNKVRTAAGMIVLSENRHLLQAAENHANYLQAHPVSYSGTQGAAHIEQESQQFFTGTSPDERALSAEYDHRLILENISIGNQNVQESVRALMSAIYHRFTFLAFSVSEIGAAVVDNNYVYELGRKQLRQTCNAPNSEDLFDGWVQCGSSKMKTSSYLKLCDDLPNKALYEAPFKSRCKNGSLLKQSYIHAACNDPPVGSIWKHQGSYYELCDSGVKTSAQWLDEQCNLAESEAIYPHDGKSYLICSDQHKVHANWYDAYCAGLSEEQRYTDSGVFIQPCKIPHKLREETLSKLTQQVQLRNPFAVVWPPDGAIEVRPAFFEEDPHPTPDKIVTGYPISVHFNPAQVSNVVINFFILEKQVGDEDGAEQWEAITNIRAISANNDVNKLFTPYQFAWFPDERLGWNSHYRYSISAQADGAPYEFRGAFRTQTLPGKLVQLQLDTESISVKQDHFYLYQLPTQLEPEPFKNIRFSNRKFVKLDVEVIDPSTLEVTLSRTACLPVEMLFDSGRRLIIHPCF